MNTVNCFIVGYNVINDRDEVMTMDSDRVGFTVDALDCNGLSDENTFAGMVYECSVGVISGEMYGEVMYDVLFDGCDGESSENVVLESDLDD